MIEVNPSPPEDSLPGPPPLGVPPQADVAPPTSAATEDEPLLLDLGGILRDAPPWLLSALIDMTALIVLGLIILKPTIETNLDLVASYLDTSGDSIIDPGDMPGSDAEDNPISMEDDSLADSAMIVPTDMPV